MIDFESATLSLRVLPPSQFAVVKVILEAAEAAALREAEHIATYPNGEAPPIIAAHTEGVMYGLRAVVDALMDFAPGREPRMPATRSCRSCGDPILWATSSSGKAIPLNPEPTPMGNVTIVVERDDVARATVHPHATIQNVPMPRYQSHFATCPQADSWRRDD